MIETIWAVKPETLKLIVAGVELAVSRPEPVSNGSDAIIPIHGVLTQRGWGWTESYDRLADEIEAAANNASVSRIILDVDSPGGEVMGIDTAANAINVAKKEKEVIAVANCEAASAAYWLASQASKFYCSPSGHVGSIGVLIAHYDVSKMMEDEGVKVSFIHAGKYKVEGNSYEPLGDDAREYLQSRVDHYYGRFVDSVAVGRKVNSAQVVDTFGEGRMIVAENAKARGMIDDVMSLRDLLRPDMSNENRIRMAELG